MTAAVDGLAVVTAQA